MGNSSDFALGWSGDGPAVEAHDLVKVFPRGNVRALDRVSLEVEAGTVLGLLGPNGAGKTTAVRILSTILEPDSGSAAILGHDVVKAPDVVRRIIGLAGQYATVDENLTGRENIYMVGRLCHLRRKVAARRADELLEGFGLSDAGNRVLKTYSGGMRRRLDLAAALVASPPVLFLDEPTTGLDPQGRQDLWGVIENLVSEGTTVLLTTQYLEEADRLADHLVVIDHGKLIAEGTPASLKAGLGATVLDIGMADSDSARRAADALRDARGLNPSVEGNIVELNVDDGPGVVSEALRVLQDCDLAPATLALREPSLDDVFIALTGHRTSTDPPPSDDAHGAMAAKGAKGASGANGAGAKNTKGAAR